MGIETALIGSALIGGASSIFGASKAEKGAKAAAKVSAQQYADSKANLEPYMTGGTNAFGDYLKSIGLVGADQTERTANQQQFFDDFQYDPGFQRFLDDTNKNSMRSYSLYGDTGGNLANALRKNSEGAIYGQFQDRRGQLSGAAAQGLNAATALAGVGQASANTQANALTQAGQYAGSGIIGAGQAGVNAFGNYAKSLGNQNGFNAGTNPWMTATVNRASL